MDTVVQKADGFLEAQKKLDFLDVEVAGARRRPARAHGGGALRRGRARVAGGGGGRRGGDRVPGRPLRGARRARRGVRQPGAPLRDARVSQDAIAERAIQALRAHTVPSLRPRRGARSVPQSTRRL